MQALCRYEQKYNTVKPFPVAIHTLTPTHGLLSYVTTGIASYKATPL